jgi:hypothetical protein
MLSLNRQNRFRERYRAMRPGWRMSGEFYESFVRRRIHADAITLDLGCGAGIDPHLPSLRQNRDAHLLRVNGDAIMLPFASATFDLVVCSWVLANDAGFAIHEMQTVHDPTYLAFNDLAFCISAGIERHVNDARAVHIGGDFERML